MNLRFDAHALRFRISSDEEKRLHVEKLLRETVQLPKGEALVFGIRVVDDGALVGPNVFAIDGDNHALWLRLHPDTLRVHAHLLASKEGLSCALATGGGHVLTVNLQVDLYDR